MSLVNLNKKDHLASVGSAISKENSNNESNSISEYQRRYDSVMDRTKGNNSSMGIYGKEKIVKRRL